MGLAGLRRGAVNRRGSELILSAAGVAEQHAAPLTTLYEVLRAPQ